ncbi:MAG TPA: efflux RND transporter periplasmic adaptor subunit [Longimicrobiales bacterium]|nr:efflux RND transporter periplasmic adaptor subunit [Longimicrobiales bacterium]
MERAQGNRRRRRWIPALLGIVVVGLIAFRVVQATADRPAQPTVEQIRAERGVPVTVAVVESGPLTIWREFSGNVGGVKEAVVRAKTGDQVAEVLVEVGSRVGLGQVLVRQSGEASGARVRQAEAALKQAQSTVNRMRPLREAGAISEQEWEGVLTQLELASADLAAARDMLVLTSPLAGTVTEVIARPGMIPSPGDPLVRVADLSRFVVSLRVSAAEAADIQEGQPARLANGEVGRVRRIALQADPATRLVEVEVEFPPTAGLVPGTLATVEVQVAARDHAVWVPRPAVRDGGVWVIDNEGVARRVAVRTGLESRDRIEILDGVSAGQRVVVEGGALLSDGARVRIINGGAGVGGDV